MDVLPNLRSKRFGSNTTLADARLSFIPCKTSAVCHCYTEAKGTLTMSI
jgi:hypothetical protein